MRKSVFTLYIAALAAMLMFSCGHSSSRDVSSSDSAATVSQPLNAVDSQAVQAAQRTALQDSLDAKYRQAIATVLHQDSDVARYYRHNDSMTVVGMRHIALDDCPRDFAVAYVDHIHAWERLAEIQEELNYLYSDNARGKEVADALWNKIFGVDDDPVDDAHAKAEKLESAKVEVNDQVKATWNEIERIATAHDVSLTQ